MPLTLTTTLAAYLAHNTSANSAYNKANYPPNFTGTTWITAGGTTQAVNSALSDDGLNPITPCHVSPVSVKTMIPSYTGKWYAHVTPWFGTGSSVVAANHANVGIDCDTSGWVVASTTDQQARGFDGIIIDWYGQGDYTDTVTLLLKTQIAGMTGFTYAIMIDQGSYSTTAELETELAYVAATYFGATNYQTQGGLPVVLFFGTVAGVDYATAFATVASFYAIMQGPGSLSNAYADACFDWVQPFSAGGGADPYNATATNSFLTSVHSSSKGSIPCISPGFNGYLTAIKEGGYKKGYYMQRNYGECWISQAATVNANLPTNIIGIQVPTWDDWEEGTAIETAIDNGLTVTASITGTILSWSISGGLGNESTLSLYSLLATPDGVNAAVLGTQAPGGSHTFDLSTVTGWGSTAYTIYVVAAGIACVRTQSASGVAYTASGGGGGLLNSNQDVLMFEFALMGVLTDSQDVLMFEIPFVASQMPFAYPITLPTPPGPADWNPTFENIVGENDSPFDFSDQVFLWPGDMLTFEGTWPPMLALQAEPLISALGLLLGKFGTVLLPDYNRLTPQGPMSGTPVVNGANASGSNQLNVRGATPSITNWAMAGDYIQVTAAGGLQRLHKILANASTNSSGDVTLNIRPSIREALADGVTIVTANCAGTFRLMSNSQPWKINKDRVYTVSFKAREAGLL